MPPPKPKPDFRITEIYAFVTVDPADNSEGVIGFRTPQGWLPAVAADKDRVDSLRQHARAIARGLENPVKLVKFSQREDIEELASD